MSDQSKVDEELNAELRRRVSDEITAYDDKNLLEQYALYMLRIQMYELSIKQDLMNIFDVGEDKAERLSLGGIYNYFIKNDLKGNPAFFSHIKHIAKQRNSMAHDFLAGNSAIASIVGEAASNRVERELGKAIFELENAWHFYVISKERYLLYEECRSDS